MIQPKEYFERFIAWKRHPDPKSPKVTYESYSAMDLNMLCLLYTSDAADE